MTWQQISLVLVQAQERAVHGIHLVTPITKKSRRQVGVLFVDDTNLLESLGENNNIDTVMEKGRAASIRGAATFSQQEASYDPTSAHTRFMS